MKYLTIMARVNKNKTAIPPLMILVRFILFISNLFLFFYIFKRKADCLFPQIFRKLKRVGKIDSIPFLEAQSPLRSFPSNGFKDPSTLLDQEFRVLVLDFLGLARDFRSFCKKDWRGIPDTKRGKKIIVLDKRGVNVSKIQLGINVYFSS